jgi:hypothetical protein
MPEPLVRAANLDKHYLTGDSTIRAISDVSLAIEQGALCVLDSKGSPTPVQVRIGESDRRATETVAGSISPRQRVLVGASVAAKGPSLFGQRLNF